MPLVPPFRLPLLPSDLLRACPRSLSTPHLLDGPRSLGQLAYGSRCINIDMRRCKEVILDHVGRRTVLGWRRCAGRYSDGAD